MNIIDSVARSSQRPKRLMTRRDGPESPSPSPRAGRAAPGRPPPTPGTLSRTSVGLIGSSVAGALAGERRLVLHDVVLRARRVRILVRPAVHDGDLARPVAVRWRGRRRPLQP